MLRHEAHLAELDALTLVSTSYVKMLTLMTVMPAWEREPAREPIALLQQPIIINDTSITSLGTPLSKTKK